MNSPPRFAMPPRILIFIVAYQAEKTITNLLRRIPTELAAYQTQVLVIDDASGDATFAVSEAARRSLQLPFELTVLVNPASQGYGGNQKLGYHFAIEHGFDIVALVHGDGQYAPELLPQLLQPLLAGEADAILGSRMLRPLDALKGGMPLHRYLGSKILTAYQNRALGSHLSEFHIGYRLYTTAALRRIPFELNTDDFHFDTEIIIQLILAGCRIRELPIPTRFGDGVSRANGIKYAWKMAEASTVARLQALSLLYRRSFDVTTGATPNTRYEAKLDYPSSHQRALEQVAPGQTVLDVGCGPGELARALKARGSRVIGVDRFPPKHADAFDEFVACDLDAPAFPHDLRDVDVVFLLDIVEHLRAPEAFCAALREAAQINLKLKIVVSTGNVAFFIPRLMLLLGQFNYGTRGILDLTHTRLFTFASWRRLFEETGFAVEQVSGIPAPFPLALGNGRLGRLLLKLNLWLIALSRSLFAYQIFMVLRPLPTVSSLLQSTLACTAQRARVLAENSLAGDQP